MLGGASGVAAASWGGGALTSGSTGGAGGEGRCGLREDGRFRGGGGGAGAASGACVSTTPWIWRGRSASSFASSSIGAPPGATCPVAANGLYPPARSSIRCAPGESVCTKGGSWPEGRPSMIRSAATGGVGVTITFPGSGSRCPITYETAATPRATGTAAYSAQRRVLARPPCSRRDLVSAAVRILLGAAVRSSPTANLALPAAASAAASTPTGGSPL